MLTRQFLFESRSVSKAPGFSKFDSKSNKLSKLIKRKEQIFSEIESHIFVHADFYQDLMAKKLSVETAMEKSLAVSKSLIDLLDKTTQYLLVQYDKNLYEVFISFLQVIGFPTKKFTKYALQNFKVGKKIFHDVSYLSIGVNISVNQKALLMIASFSRESFGRIVYTSSESQDLLDYPSERLIGRKINDLMPICYSKIHDELVQNYFTKNVQENTGHINCILNKQQRILQVHLQYKIYPYFMHDVRMVD